MLPPIKIFNYLKHTNIMSICVAKIFDKINALGKHLGREWKSTVSHLSLRIGSEMSGQEDRPDLITSIGDRINFRSRWGTTCHVNTSRQSKPPIWGSPELPRYSKVFQSITSITGHTTADSFSWILQIPNTSISSVCSKPQGGSRSSRMNAPLPAEKNHSWVRRPLPSLRGLGHVG